MGIATFQNVSGEKGHFILLETGHSTRWERFFPLGIGPLILWDSRHPLGNGTWETGHAIFLDSDHLSSGKYPLGIGNLGDEVQPFSGDCETLLEKRTSISEEKHSETHRKLSFDMIKVRAKGYSKF